MTARSVRPRLQDILDNIAIVTDAIVGHDLASFTGNPVLRLAMERAIEIRGRTPYSSGTARGDRGLELEQFKAVAAWAPEILDKGSLLSH